ncbi:splicing factor 3B subunit 1-like [Dorcoceras hygrometricum]|uniref:Splicing factor 3B subunit 1-like n=1 Tax=Dorcoceras hygrometricum TaxID=472368 RepID=A0A2Z7CLA3_9LAMI|nr:splicing factor 3B subunit 1-like [Dorcoceras hygrometricum]
MASPLINNAIQVYFDSVIGMEHEGMVSMFEALVCSGLSGFLGCSSAIYEAALVEFFHNASVRDGKVVSTVQRKPVAFSEELFAGMFELPLEGLTDIHEVPKDLVFEVRCAFSYDGKQLSTSCKKREMTFEFRLLNDILAKSVTVKAGSFDDVTHERLLMMYAIHGGIWNWGESKEFPPLKILTAKTVGTYIAKNKNIFVDEDEPVVEKPAEKKKAVSKKRPATTVETPVVKRKGTTGRAAPEAKSLALVTVAQEAVPIQMVSAVTPPAPKRKAPKRKLKLPVAHMETDMEEPSLARSDDIVVKDTERSNAVNDEDDNLDGAENEIAKKMASFTAPKQLLKEPLRSGEDEDMSGSKQL